MNSVPTITPNSIVAMSGNDQRPVYFLTMAGGNQPTLTVKGEVKKEDSEISIKWSSKLMKNVNDSQVNTKIMNAGEIAIFKTAAQAFLATEPKKLIALNQASITWVKMPYLPGLSDADFWRRDAEGTYYTLGHSIRKLLVHFSNPNVWTQLGKIVAVDLFNGNNDRFNSAGDWVNQGNIMFQNQANGGIKVVGLDTFDSVNQSANLTRNDNAAGLNVLRSPQAMRTYAATAIGSVEYEITRGLPKSGNNYFTLQTDNGPIRVDKDSVGFLMGYEDDFVAGLQQGTNELKAYLQRKKQIEVIRHKPLPQIPGGPPNKPLPMTPGRGPIQMGGHRAPQPPSRPNAMPQGILDRMASLGW